MVRDGIAVIIPCYNEALTVGKVIDDFRSELPEAAVYVYDNNSTDGTAEIARTRGAIVKYEPRQGKGNVCRQILPRWGRRAPMDAGRFGSFACAEVS